MIALVLERLTAGRGFMMALLLIPWSMITVINAELWGYIYQGTYGVADAILNAVGLGSPNILGTPTPAIIGLMIADIWKTTPFVAIIVLAGLVMLPGDIYEAAEVDGSSGWSTFWRITVPLLRPTLALAVMFRVLQAFGLFDLPYVLTDGGPGTATTSLAILGYNAIFKNLAFGPGAAVATTTALLVLLGCLLSLRTFRVQVGKEGTNAQSQADRLAPDHQRRQHLGVLRRPVRRAAAVLADRLQLQDADRAGGQPAAVLPEPAHAPRTTTTPSSRMTSASTSATRSS